MSNAPRMRPELAGKDGIAVTVGEVYTFPVHSHAYYELIFYAPFKGEVTVNASSLLPDRPLAVLMTPVDLHATVCTEAPSRFVKIAFTEDALGGYLSKRLSNACVLPMTESDSTVARLRDRLVSSQDCEEARILLRAVVLLLLDCGEALPSLRHTPSHALSAAAVAIIQEEFASDLTLKALARRLNVSHQHLSACFAKSTGRSFSAYLCETRLRYAGALLRSTDDTATEICYACGYRNLSHFLRSFKNQYGVTPKEYRSNLTWHD